MAKHRVHSIEFKRQVAAEFAAGETLYSLARRHDVCRNLIRVWVAKAEADEFDEEIEASNLMSASRRRSPPLSGWSADRHWNSSF